MIGWLVRGMTEAEAFTYRLGCFAGFLTGCLAGVTFMLVIRWR